jgi:hypothetical protein
MASRVSVFSVTNLAEQATITASSQATGFEATNVVPAGRPFYGWRSTGVSGQFLKLQRTATPGDVLALYVGNVNFSTLRVQASDTDDYSTLGVTFYQYTVPMSRNIFNWRYQSAVILPEEMNKTFLRLRVVTAIDPAATYLTIGDLWLGLATKVDLLHDISFQTITPRTLIDADSGAFTEELIMGEPRARLSVNRRARTDRLTPGMADDLTRWTEIDRQMYSTGGLFIPTINDPTNAFIVRQVGQYGWTRQRLNFMDSHMDLDEIVGP